MTPTDSPKKRLLYIDSAKGLAIILVVIGHIAGRSSPPGNEWYDVIKAAIYTFHMPLFMFLSGLVFQLSDGVGKANRGYQGFVRDRAYRLLVPFFGLGLLILIGKIFLDRIVEVDRVPDSPISGFLHLFIQTNQSPSIFIWYVFTLFVYVAFTPLLLKWIPINKLLIISLLMYFVPAPDFMYLDRVVEFYVFFLLGMKMASNSPLYERVLGAWPWLAIASIIAGTAMVMLAPMSTFDSSVGFLAIWPILALVRSVGSWNFLLYIGKYSFAIYLFNTMAIGVGRVVLGKVLPWGGPLFPLFALALVAIGVAGPIAFKVLLLDRIAPLKKLTN